MKEIPCQTVINHVTTFYSHTRKKYNINCNCHMSFFCYKSCDKDLNWASSHCDSWRRFSYTFSRTKNDKEGSCHTGLDPKLSSGAWSQVAHWVSHQWPGRVPGRWYYFDVPGRPGRNGSYQRRQLENLRMDKGRGFQVLPEILPLTHFPT